MSIQWQFKTDKLTVRLDIKRERGYRYDGEDPDGEIQAQLEEGELVAFTSTVEVLVGDEPEPIGWASLHGSVYQAGRVSDFWTDHRTAPFEGRNTLALKARNTVICHYFPGLVAEACAMAREELQARLRDMPRIRRAA